MRSFRLGSTTVEIHDGWSVTRFADGEELHALHGEQPGQAEVAKWLGMSVERMNVTHDIAHSLLCHLLGLPHSGSLRAAATRSKPRDVDWIEEEAVLALQKFAHAAGVDLLEVAQRVSERQTK